MFRLPIAVALAALVVGGSLSCSGSDTAATKTRADTTPTTTQQTTSETSPPQSPPPMAIPLSTAKRKRVYRELAQARDQGIGEPEVYALVARREGMGEGSVRLIEREGSLRRWRLPAAPKITPAAVRVRPAPAAAKRLRSTVTCSANAPRTGVANLRWRPARRPVVRQWVVVTIFQKGFALDHYEASRPLPPRARSFQWRRMHGQAIHHWRVIARDRSGRWLGSAVATFTGPTCVAEFEP